jgi:hypothetical protein
MDAPHCFEKTSLKVSATVKSGHDGSVLKVGGCQQVTACFSEKVRRSVQRIASLTSLAQNLFALLGCHFAVFVGHCLLHEYGRDDLSRQ